MIIDHKHSAGVLLTGPGRSLELAPASSHSADERRLYVADQAS